MCVACGEHSRERTFESIFAFLQLYRSRFLRSELSNFILLLYLLPELELKGFSSFFRTISINTFWSDERRFLMFDAFLGVVLLKICIELLGDQMMMVMVCLRCNLFIEFMNLEIKNLRGMEKLGLWLKYFVDSTIIKIFLSELNF